MFVIKSIDSVVDMITNSSSEMFVFSPCFGNYNDLSFSTTNQVEQFVEKMAELAINFGAKNIDTSKIWTEYFNKPFVSEIEVNEFDLFNAGSIEKMEPPFDKFSCFERGDEKKNRADLINKFYSEHLNSEHLNNAEDYFVDSENEHKIYNKLFKENNPICSKLRLFYHCLEYGIPVEKHSILLQSKSDNSVPSDFMDILTGLFCRFHIG